MITNFKIFESINRSSKPNLNDYVMLFKHKKHWNIGIRKMYNN